MKDEVVNEPSDYDEVAYNTDDTETDHDNPLFDEKERPVEAPSDDELPYKDKDDVNVPDFDDDFVDEAPIDCVQLSVFIISTCSLSTFLLIL